MLKLLLNALLSSYSISLHLFIGSALGTAGAHFETRQAFGLACLRGRECGVIYEGSWPRGRDLGVIYERSWPGEGERGAHRRIFQKRRGGKRIPAEHISQYRKLPFFCSGEGGRLLGSLHGADSWPRGRARCAIYEGSPPRGRELS